MAVYFLILLLWVALIKFLNWNVRFFPLVFRTIIHWLHSVTFEIFLVVMSLFLRPWGYLTNQKKFTGTFSGRPICLIHGYLHDSSAWVYMKKKLASEGFGPIYTLNLMHPFLSIESYAKSLQKKTKEIALETGRTDLILIGHSMGGLVACEYAIQQAPVGTVTDVITLGSPLKGTYAAYCALGVNGRQMRPRSHFIKELQEKIKAQKTIRFYHVGTKTDQLIIPSSSAWMGQFSEKQFVVNGIGHVTLLFSPRVFNKIQEWLAKATSKSL